MEYRVRRHDAYQVEVKVGYPLQRDHPRETFGLEMFLFFPYQLAVNSATYSAHQFYTDLRSYTRYKTPDIALRDLINPENALSPLTRVQRRLTEGRESGRWDESGIEYELKVLGMVVVVQARDRVRAIRRILDSKHGPDRSQAVAATEELLNDLDAVLDRVHALGQGLAPSPTPRRVGWVYGLVDEHITVRVEGHLFRLLDGFQRYLSSAERATAARIVATVRREMEHRRAMGYSTVDAAKSRRNERLLHREGLLKKFCASALFLTLDADPTTTRARQFLYGLAAGLAMAFAAAAAWVASFYYQQNTLPFILVLVIAYVFKDRIKDFVREHGGRVLPSVTGDRRNRLVDRAYARAIGRSSETMRWPNRRDIPPEVLELRRCIEPLEREVVEPGESILLYTKKVHIDPRAVYRYHQRAIAIDEILRVQLSQWLEAMDAPRKPLPTLDDGTDRILSLSTPRVYHVPLVLRLTTQFSGIVELTKATLVLSREGIERIE